MARRALLTILALIAGFIVSALPHSDLPQHHTTAATALVQAIPGATTRSTPTPPQPGLIGQTNPPRTSPTPLRVLMDVARRLHRTPDTTTPLGDRAPPPTSA